MSSLWSQFSYGKLDGRRSNTFLAVIDGVCQYQLDQVPCAQRCLQYLEILWIVHYHCSDHVERLSHVLFPFDLGNSRILSSIHCSTNRGYGKRQ